MWYKPLVVTEFKNTTCLSQVLQGRDSITFPVLSIHIQEGGCDLEPLRHLCSSCWCRWQRWLRGHRHGGQAAVASVSAAPAGGLGHPEASSCTCGPATSVPSHPPASPSHPFCHTSSLVFGSPSLGLPLTKHDL